MKFTEAAVTGLATFRVTKLVLDDEILLEAREAAERAILKINNRALREKLIYLMNCPWCVSMYGAAALLGIKFVAPKVYEYLTLLLAASAATGLIYERT